MKDKGKDIEDLFRERFSNNEAPVSPKVWQSIQSTLPPPFVSMLGLGVIKNMMLWSAVALISATVAIGSYLYVAKDSSVLAAKPKEKRLSNSERNNTFYMDSTKSNAVDQIKLRNASLDSIHATTPNLKSMSSSVTIFDKKNSMEKLSCAIRE